MMTIIKPETESVLQAYGFTTASVPKKYNDETRRNFMKFAAENGFSTVEDAGEHLFNIIQILSHVIDMSDSVIAAQESDCGMTFTDETFENPSAGIFCAKSSDFFE